MVKKIYKRVDCSGRVSFVLSQGRLYYTQGGNLAEMNLTKDRFFLDTNIIVYTMNEGMVKAIPFPTPPSSDNSNRNAKYRMVIQV